MLDLLICFTEAFTALYVCLAFGCYALKRLPVKPIKAIGGVIDAAVVAIEPAPPQLAAQPLVGSSQPAYVITIPVSSEGSAATEPMSREEMKRYPGVRDLRKQGAKAGIKGAARMNKTNLLKLLGYV